MSIMLNMAALLLKWHQIQNIYPEMPNNAYNPHMVSMSKILKTYLLWWEKWTQCSFSLVDSYNTDRWPNILLFTNSIRLNMSMLL